MAHVQPTELLKAVEAVWARLYEYLARAIGAAGYVALVTRALAIAAERQPVLGNVKAGGPPDPWLRGLDASIERHGSDTVREAVAELLSETIALLSRFIGADLSVRLIETAWPDPSDTSDVSAVTEETDG